MEEYGPPLSELLQTPDPHYVPGYTGYCPQLKYNIGKSFGQLTEQLLTSPTVKHSNMLVLNTGRIPSTQSHADQTLESIPESDYNRVIPGYTGFIPKRQNYFARSYSETCQRALSDFYKDGREKIQKKSTPLPVVVDYNKQQLERPKPPFSAISNQEITCRPSESFTPTGNPYIMDDDDPHKYFISGFTGHVPKSRFLIGKGFPFTTNKALVQFGKQQGTHHMLQDIPTRRDRPIPNPYPSNRGVVPSFTGHIPGYRFMSGQSFGQLSKDALENSGIKRRIQA